MLVVDQIKIGTSLCKKDSAPVSSLYLITDIQPQHWSDGSTGIQLQRMIRGDEVGVKFWINPQELDSKYQVYGN